MNLLNFPILLPDKETWADYRDQQGVAKMLPWVHIAKSNAKRILPNVFHYIKPKYLQSDMNEFCYKFNRQYFGDERSNRPMVATETYKNQLRHNIM